MARATKRGRRKSGQPWPAAKIAAFLGTSALVLFLGVKLYDVLGIADRDFGWGGRGQRDAAVDRPSERPDPLVVGLSRALSDVGIDPTAIERTVAPQIKTGRSVIERWEIGVPRKISLVECNLVVTRTCRELGAAVLDAWEHRQPHGDRPALTIVLAPERRPDPQRMRWFDLSWWIQTTVQENEREPDERLVLTFVKLPPAERALMAVVIDDFGFAWNETVRSFLEFPASLTFAVLPGLRSSARIAEFARDRGHEVILHMPMEPERYPHEDPGDDAILITDRPVEIRARLRRALKSVGEVSGVSNHMGSLVTTDPGVMGVVLSELDGRGLYFIDSKTTPRSIACREARRRGVPCVDNRLFLDHRDRSPGAIAERFEEAVDIALRRREVLVIGHAYPETYEVLKGALPELEEQGIRLVTVSGLIGPGFAY